MKHIFKHPEPTEKDLAGPKYWRSLDELADTPGFREFLEREFPDGASTLEGVDRRNFLKIMAASFALAGVGMTGCRRPERHILPFARQPEQMIPGRPLYYATAMPLRRQALPLLAETHEGRPTKLEGNPSFPLTKGKTDLIGQAAVLDLYDPDRATRHSTGADTITRDQALALLRGLGQNHQGGSGLAFLAEQTSSPTQQALVNRIREQFPQAIWAEYEAWDESVAERAAARVVGQPARPFYHLDRASRILAVDADVINFGPGSVHYAQAFARGRRIASPQDEMNRLYSVESNFTVTGGMADHRLRLPTSLMPAFVARVGIEVLSATGNPGAPALQNAAAALDETQTNWARECARDLVENAGRSLIVAGTHLPEAVQAMVFGLNQALGNVGQTIDFLQTDTVEAATIQELAQAISANQVQTLVILGGNPVHNAPVDLNWSTLQGRVNRVIRYGYHFDETSELAQHHIAAAHFLESWGDARAIDGTVLAIQPMILPLFGGLSVLEALAAVAGDQETDGYDLVRQTIDRLTNGGGEAAFRRFLYDGFLAESAYPTIQAQFQSGQMGAIAGEFPAAPQTLSRQNLEINFIRDSRIDDGRFVNNGWLQECPDPVTKLTWGNAIIISPRLADELGIVGGSALLQVARRNPNEIRRGREHAPIARLTVGGQTLEGPVHIQTGLANYSVILPLGYGRKRVGRIGDNYGINPSVIRTSAAFFTAVGATLEITDQPRYQLANGQEHWSLEGRDIFREANLEYYRKNPGFTNAMGIESHAPPNLWGAENLSLQEQLTKTPRGMSHYEHPKMPGHNQWGMVIDLNTCTGCSACVIACQAENNVPIVGKDQVLRGREMHWLRLDRYFASGSRDNTEIPEDPQMVTQPMLCQHCDNAPCEMVCPVNATIQDEEGLNVMVYNRCVGTRYCANNCPYKVRRFNFFDWNERQLDKLYLGPLSPKGMAETLKMQKNPDVTVRMRGVMEKCTFCIQRINAAKIDTKVRAGASDDVVVPEGVFQTACQQACPTESIVFGNMMNEDSEVVRLKKSDRNYSVLGYLNVRPRLTYLSRLRNPNPRMPDYLSQPLTYLEYFNANYPQNGQGGHTATPGLTTLNGGSN